MKIESIKNFKEKIKQKPVFGPFSKTSDPGMIEVIGHAGFDFVILDMEHGPNGLETVQNLIRAAEKVDLIPIVRVPENDLNMISKVLDIGAAGVQVPQITNAEDVKKVLNVAKFSPFGERGACRYVRAANYSSTDKKIYFEEANESILIIQLEGQEALENLNEILEVKGPDIIFVGPYDLSQSLGVTGEIDHPLVIEKMKEIVDACLQKNILVGNFNDTPEQAKFWVDQGLSYLSISVDMGIMYNASKSLIEKCKS